MRGLTPRPPLLKERGRKSFPSPLGEGWPKAGVRLLLLALATQALTAAPMKSAPVVVGEAPTEAPAKKLIFLDFYNEANDKNLQYVANSIGDAVHESIKGKYRYDRIASSTWKKYAAQQKWTEKDFFDAVKIREMGRVLGADGVIYGKYVSKEGNLEIQGVIFSVIDGEIVDEQNGQTPTNAQMFETINQVADNLAKKIKDLFVPSDRGALTRSLLFPGWGHHYKQRHGWGNFWMISGGTAVAFTATMGTLFVVMKNQYDTYKPQHYKNDAGGTGLYDQAAAQSEFDRLETQANQYGQLALIGGVVTAGIWLGAMLHAYFIEPDVGNAALPKVAEANPLQFNLGADESALPGLRATFSYTGKF